MPVTAILKQASHGQFFTCAGKKAGQFRFTRNPKSNLLELTFPSFDAFNAVADELLTTKGNPPMFIKVTPETAASDTAIAAELDETKAKLTEALGGNERLQQEAEAAKLALENGKGGITEDEREMLGERDAMLSVLAPLATAEETPLQCLTRLLGKPSEAAPVDDPLALPYEDLLKYAKEVLDLPCHPKPSKAKLIEDVKAKLAEGK